MATIMAWVMQLLVLKLLAGCVDAHITKFRGLVMKLNGKGIVFPEALLAVIFLKSLSSQFTQFVTYQMQKQTLNIHQLYKDAIEFGKCRSHTGYKYAVCFVCCASRRGKSYAMRDKTEVVNKWRQFLASTERTDGYYFGHSTFF